jgi:hypothetical protein
MAFLPAMKNPFMRKHNLNGSGVKAANGHVAAPSEDLQKNVAAFAMPLASWPEDDVDEEDDEDLEDDELDVDEVEVEEEVEVAEDPDVEDLDTDLDLDDEDEEEDDL